MSNLHAIPVVKNQFWVVEEGSSQVGMLRFTPQKKYVLTANNYSQTFDDKQGVVKQFGTEFFTVGLHSLMKPKSTVCEVDGYPTKCLPHNPVIDVRHSLPVYNKTNKSQVLYCAGYYIINYTEDKGWFKSYCPKFSTLMENRYYGPFKTEDEMKRKLADVTATYKHKYSPGVHQSSKGS